MGCPHLWNNSCLFEICNNQDCVVKNLGVVSMTSLFRRRLDSELLAQWHALCSVIGNIHITQDKDTVYWGLNKSARFTTKSTSGLKNPLVVAILNGFGRLSFP